MHQWNLKTVGLLISCGCIAGSALAANPVIPGYADPAMRVWGDKLYMAVGKDLEPGMDRFTMVHWAIYSSSNLIDWELVTHIRPEDTYLGAGYTGCWASDITEKDGAYYFYFSNRNQATGVLQADNPNGPYRDVLKKPMLEASMSENHEYDPTVFTDDDGQKYLIYGIAGGFKGHVHHYQIAKLSEDMVSLAEEPRDLMTSEKYSFSNEKRAQDHQYFHKHNGIYYLSCAGAYMTSTNVYGPFENIRHAGQVGHTSFIDFHGQSYYATEWACDPYGDRKYRQCVMTYLHYKDNGDMVGDSNFMQNTPKTRKEGIHYRSGVGNYSAQWKTIEAEWYFRIEGAVKKECPAGGFEIQKITDGGYLNFPYMRSLKKGATIHFEVSCANAEGAMIEVRDGSPTGTLLGTCSVPSTGGWNEYRSVSCKLKNTKVYANLYVVFKGNGTDLLHLDSFHF